MTMNTLHETTNVSSSSPDMDTSMNGSSSGAVAKSKTALRKEELDKIAKELKKKLLRASITAKQLSPTNLRNGAGNAGGSSGDLSSNGGIHKTSASPFRNPLARRSYSSTSNMNSNKGSNKNIASASPVAVRTSSQRQESSSTLGGPNGTIFLSSSPSQLISPDGKSPTHIKTPGILLGSSPLKKVASKYNTSESPTKKKGKQGNPQMILQQVQPPSSPPKFGITTALVPENKSNRISINGPSSPLSVQSQRTTMVPTTPTLSKNTLSSGNQGNSSLAASRTNALLKTPTQGRGSSHGNGYNDDEGADLLMYLATSPSPAKPFMQPNTPRANMGSGSSGAIKNNGSHQSSSSGANTFLAPPPLTPKRHMGFSNGLNARTPQNRMTPAINLLLNVNIPPSGVTSTPAGFNMNDYVNFLTPSPGVSLSSRMNPAKTPDFNSLLGATSNLSKKIGGNLASKGTGSRLSGEQLHSDKGSIVEEDEHGETEPVDGKMINFDKVLFDSGDMPKSGNRNGA